MEVARQTHDSENEGENRNTRLSFLICVGNDGVQGLECRSSMWVAFVSYTKCREMWTGLTLTPVSCECVLSSTLSLSWLWVVVCF